ncbi:hypothetical protein TraAM80_01187 [Trypanosoma rangeli]|uniref:Uncharacterized protein n=1 Tax=Trypanosoma rangeli TaxID=5698 RepID=A0A422P005_TRYRA|nr:uncharacterized protein TraAM80_01187 [Trypanosoma rangeli]RNF11060.1 hypothetical protein TraAM80_01187 [Trypanosoma rangeli]|eukprot:RNF11060.1 hypothetical protein TraAM80_01187 [Trypanosoma rangeli]
MCAIECFALCSRAVNILAALTPRKVIRSLDNIGTHAGGAVQMSFFMAVVALQFIILYVFAVWRSPLFGLKVSFAAGWLCAFFTVATCHVFFFRLAESATVATPGGRILCPPCFLLLNKPEVTEGKSELHTLCTSSCVVCGIPVLLSLLFGIGFLISCVVGFAVAVCTAAILASFLVTYHADSMPNALNGSLLQAAIWIASLVWIFDCYTFSFHSYSSIWCAPVAISLFVAAWFLVFSFV